MSVANTTQSEKASHYINIRMAFMLMGSSLHAWCGDEGIHMQNARAAILGQWSGPKAIQLIEKIEIAAGIR